MLSSFTGMFLFDLETFKEDPFWYIYLIIKKNNRMDSTDAF